MRSTDAPYLADGFSISLRWLILFSLTLTLAIWGQLDLLTALPLCLAAVWNILTAILNLAGRRAPAQTHLALVIDLTVALASFYQSGGLSGPLFWAAMLPVICASLHYRLLATMGIALVASLGQLGLAYYSVWQTPGSLLHWDWMGVLAGGNLLLGLVLGFLGNQVLSKLPGRFLKNRPATNGSRARRPADNKPAETVSTEQQKDRLKVIYELTTTLTATLNYQVVLDAAQDLCAKALYEDQNAASRMVSVVFFFNDDLLQVGSARRLTPTDMRATLPGITGMVGEALRTGQLALSDNPSADPELTRIIALRACQSAIGLPLRHGLESYGILIFGHPEAKFFTPDRQEILEIISHQAVVAIQNARLYQNLLEEKEHIVEAQEEARKKLARDLHDGPTQSVSAIAMRVNFTRKLLERDVNAAAEELVRIEDLARRTTKEIRHMLFTLRPLVLESEGLIPALQAMADKMKETFDQNVQIQVDPALLEELEIGKQTVVFYIAEEAVNNARKHAQANLISVRLKRIRQEQEIAMLEIEDNGVGFDVAAVNSSYERRGSLGMVNLQERSELVNGLLHIDSAPGKGTRVQVFIPLTEAAADKLHHVH